MHVSTIIGHCHERGCYRICTRRQDDKSDVSRDVVLRSRRLLHEQVCQPIGAEHPCDCCVKPRSCIYERVCQTKSYERVYLHASSVMAIIADMVPHTPTHQSPNTGLVFRLGLKLLETHMSIIDLSNVQTIFRRSSSSATRRWFRSWVGVR